MGWWETLWRKQHYRLYSGNSLRVMSVNRGVVEGVGWWETLWRKLHYRLYSGNSLRVMSVNRGVVWGGGRPSGESYTTGCTVETH